MASWSERSALKVASAVRPCSNCASASHPVQSEARPMLDTARNVEAFLQEWHTFVRTIGEAICVAEERDVGGNHAPEIARAGQRDPVLQSRDRQTQVSLEKCRKAERPTGCEQVRGLACPARDGPTLVGHSCRLGKLATPAMTPCEPLTRRNREQDRLPQSLT